MQSDNDRRREKRIRFSWPLWFGYEENGQFVRGQVVDLSRSGVGFTISGDACPAVGTHVITRFSYPLEQENHFTMDSYYHWAQVLRVDSCGNGSHRVGMRLHQPLAHRFNESEPTATSLEPVLS